MPTITQSITAVILAGGKGSRLGGLDKGLVELNNKPLIQHLINRIQPQVSKIMISANRNLDIYKNLGFPVYEDESNNFAGPLAGILKALQECESEWLLSVPADSPFIPTNLVLRLSQHSQNVKIVIPHDGENLHPTFALIHKSLEVSLKNFLNSGERKARAWMQQQPHSIVDFSDQTHAFININTEAELKNAEQHFQTFMA
ncbi:MAG: molybdenum cofactor guanylyltransferase MobA [Gammaproteobacteria bacterium]|nr:molybdenum cofactor guanylyltransferase MobA [Gammaproteobacteria bacterium]